MARDHLDTILEAWARERPDLDFSPWAITRRIARAAKLLESGERLYEPRGLNRGLGTVLSDLRLSAGQQLSPSELARSSLSTAASITGRIDDLEAAGYVRRLPNPSDRRGLRVELTDKGREVSDSIIAAAMAIRAQQVEGLSSERRSELAELLRDLIVSLEGPSPEPQAG